MKIEMSQEEIHDAIKQIVEGVKGGIKYQEVDKGRANEYFALALTKLSWIDAHFSSNEIKEQKLEDEKEEVPIDFNEAVLEIAKVLFGDDSHKGESPSGSKNAKK